MDLRALARRSADAAQVRRLLALAVICAGGTRRDAALAGGVGLQTVRDWVLRFNAQGPDRLIGGKAPGKLPLLNGAQREALAGVVEAGPELALHGVVRWRPDLAARSGGSPIWRIADLVAWLHTTFEVTVSPQTLIPTAL